MKKSKKAVITERMPAPFEQVLLHTRHQASRMLNVSVATLQRLEKQGVLKPVKLHPEKATANTFYRRADLLRLAGVDGDHRGSAQ